MTIRRCPQCHSTCDDQFGFCIKCGYEFQNITQGDNVCPSCNFQNPPEADYCVKCGAPLIFKQFTNDFSPLKENTLTNGLNMPRTSRIIIVLGYIFSLLGGLIGLIIAIYLSTRKDPVARKHGHVQLAIFAFYLILIFIFIATGAITMNDFNQVFNLNMTNMSGL